MLQADGTRGVLLVQRNTVNQHQCLQRRRATHEHAGNGADTAVLRALQASLALQQASRDRWLANARCLIGVITVVCGMAALSGWLLRVAVTTVSGRLGTVWACAEQATASEASAANVGATAVARGIAVFHGKGKQKQVPSPPSPTVPERHENALCKTHFRLVGRYPGWQNDLHHLPRQLAKWRHPVVKDESGGHQRTGVHSSAYRCGGSAG